MGGSDFHHPGWDAPPGWPTTWFEAEDEDVLGALRAGRVTLSLGPDAPVAVRRGEELLVVGGDGTEVVDGEGRPRRVDGDRARLRATTGPYRVVDGNGQALALTA